jgi:putative copper resistance protein D
MSPAAALTPVEILSKVNFDPAPILIVLVSTVWYLKAVGRLKAAGQHWPSARTAMFCYGQLALVFGAISGLSAYDRTDFAVQATQYALVGMVAPAFIGLSAPFGLALAAGGERTRAVASGLVNGPIGRAASRLWVTWPLYVIPIFVLYLTPLSGVASHNTIVDQFVYLGLFTLSFFFTWAVIGADPLPRRFGFWYRIGYILLTMPLYSILGMSLESQAKPVSSNIYANDLHTGGGIVWTLGECMAVAGALAVWIQWLRADERAAKKVDEAGEIAAEKQLAHWRETRDAAARAIGK